ncbi:hypothetical protein HNP40_003918 [Mycobacteroides chelonae]|nr:hypothetical protein [Mycobacteroides chelonae]
MTTAGTWTVGGNGGVWLLAGMSRRGGTVQE